MISHVLTKDQKALIKLYKNMKPEERLTAFLNHSRSIHRLYRAGKAFRGPSAKIHKPKDPS